MQKHAIALGYFFLAVFCVYVSSQGPPAFRSPLLLAALAASLAGAAFLVGACLPHVPATKAWIVNMIHLAQQPPEHDLTFDEERGV